MSLPLVVLALIVGIGATVAISAAQAQNNAHIAATAQAQAQDSANATATAQAQPSVPQLKSSYAGYFVNQNGIQGGMNLYIDSEDTQGNLSARISTSAGEQYECIGKIGSDDIMDLTCKRASDGSTMLLHGMLQQDGSMAGTYSAGERWQVS